MHIRSAARLLALQILYQVEITHEPVEVVLKNFWSRRSVSPAIRDFTEQLVRGTLEHLPILDRAIEEISEHWSLERMPVLDRCILRCAAYELLYHRETPPAVVINEAVELAKRFSTEHSSAFVNAILDKLKGKRETP